MTIEGALHLLRGAVMDALDCVPEPCWYLSFKNLEPMTGIQRETLRGIVADLREDGLVEYQRGLMTEDGELAGSGYRLTAAGLAWVREQTGQGV